MKKHGWLLSVFLCIFSGAVAQVAPGSFGYFQDALRYSRTFTGGTARMQALGGAGTGLGGEISSAWLNPAGLGMVQRSHITFTPTVTSFNADADFRGEPTNDFRVNVNFSHLGVVLHLPANRRRESKFRGGSLAFTLARQNDFQQQFSYQGTSDSLSIIDSFLERADGVPWSALDDELNFGITSDLGLAYATYLINPDVFFDETGFDTYYSFVPGARNLQTETVERRGAQNQFNIAYGGNYDDRVFFGVSLGIQQINYRESRTYSEVYDNQSPLRELVLRDNLRVRGVGANLSFGILARLTDFFRLGWQVVTPTFIYLDEEYDADLTTLYNNYFFEAENILLNRQEAQTLILESNYTLLTPFRTSLGASLIIGKRGFLTGELEYVNYGSAKLGSPSFADDFRADNTTIGNLYTNVLNWKGGAEIRLDPVRLRGGIALYADPFAEVDERQNLSVYSFGIGSWGRAMFFDLTFSYRRFDSQYSPYQFADPAFTPRVEITNAMVTIAASVGFFF